MVPFIFLLSTSLFRLFGLLILATWINLILSLYSCSYWSFFSLAYLVFILGWWECLSLSLLVGMTFEIVTSLLLVLCARAIQGAPVDGAAKALERLAPSSTVKEGKNQGIVKIHSGKMIMPSRNNTFNQSRRQIPHRRGKLKVKLVNKNLSNFFLNT